MPDHARSTAPAVQAQLDRLWALSPGADVLEHGMIDMVVPRHDLRATLARLIGYLAPREAA